MQFLEEIQKLTISQKAELFDLLQHDDELNEYMDGSSNASPELLFQEIKRRDDDFEAGKIKLITKNELTTRLNTRRNAV